MFHNFGSMCEKALSPYLVPIFEADYCCFERDILNQTGIIVNFVYEILDQVTVTFFKIRDRIPDLDMIPVQVSLAVSKNLTFSCHLQ